MVLTGGCMHQRYRYPIWEFPGEVSPENCKPGVLAGKLAERSNSKAHGDWAFLRMNPIQAYQRRRCVPGIFDFWGTLSTRYVLTVRLETNAVNHQVKVDDRNE